MSENIIEIKNLIFEYPQDEEEEKRAPAIDGVSIDVERGSFTAIIGQNGSGKSTLAKNLNGLLLPTGGKVFVKGWDTADEAHIWDVRQSAGMVFQNPDNQLVSSVVEDDVAFGPENLGIEPDLIRERVDGGLAAVGMQDYRRKAPHTLSGGQKQRIAIAGTIAMRPECIIFDEPTAMLDPSGRRDIMEIIKELNAEGITVILITHFMEEAAQAGRIIIMNKGRISMDGSPAEVFTEREKLMELGLDIPMAVEIADYLRGRGIKVPRDVISKESLRDFICQYK